MDKDNYISSMNYDNIRKSIVNITVIIFGFIIILIFILLILYYITPNNYEIIHWDINKFKLENQIEYILKPHSTINIDNISNIGKNYYLKFSEKTDLLVKNIFKSQNISINEESDLIKSNYDSEIFLVNNSKTEKKVVIFFYKHK